MKRLLQKDRLCRMALAFLLALGLVLPLLLALELGAQLPLAIGAALLVTLLLGALTLDKRAAIIGCAALAAVALASLALPGRGLIGGAVEGVKALMLRFSGLEVALPLFARQVALTLSVALAALCYAFTKRGVGFIPAAILLLLVLFGLWSLGKPDLLWYATPALVALLLVIAQNAHEAMEPFHALPLALAVVLVSLLVLPSGKVTVPPLEQAASDLKQTIEDYLFFTDKRNVFTLATYGYYPLARNNNNALGGPVEPDPNPVMIVQTDRKTLLRAVVRSYYDGHSFSDKGPGASSTARRYLYINPRYLGMRRSVFLEDLPSEAIQRSSTLFDQKAVNIQMQNNTASTLFTPLYLRKLNTQSDMVAYFNDSSELFITRDLKRDDQYTVYAPVFEGGDEGLGALIHASLKDDAQYQSVLAQYSQLPSHMEQKMQEDVASIVAGYDTPYDKTLAIMRHLQRYYAFTLEPDAPPENQDFVTYFLYVGKEGYCTYFASAMTVMCRMAGLPARYVEGFVAYPSADGLAYVTGEQAHAWTEVYYEGFGWVPFDPTPSEQESGSTPPPQEEPSPSPTPSPTPPPPNDSDTEDTPTPPPDTQDDPEPSPSPDPEDQSETPPDDPPPFPWWLIAALAALAAIGLMIWRVSSRMPERVAAKQATDKDKCFVYGNAVYAALLLTRHPPKSGETPIMFAKRLDGIHAYPVPITPLWRVLALSEYSRMQPGPAQSERARDTWRRLYKGLRPLQRLRFLLKAGFGKGLYTAMDTVLLHEQPPKPPTFRLPAAPSGTKRRPPKGKPPAGAPGAPGAPTAPTASAKPANRPAPSRGKRAPDARGPAETASVRGNASLPAKGGAAGAEAARPAQRDSSGASAPNDAPPRDGQPTPRRSRRTDGGR